MATAWSLRRSCRGRYRAQSKCCREEEEEEGEEDGEDKMPEVG